MDDVPGAERLRRPDEAGGPGASLMLAGVVLLGGSKQSRDAAQTGISLRVPAGQSVALCSGPDDAAIALLDVVAGLRRARSGDVVVDGLAIHRLTGAALERYRGERGLMSGRFPLLSSLSVTDNVLASLRTRRADAAARQRAAEMLALADAAQLATRRAASLSAEQQWRTLIARALLPAPPLVLAEDPSPALDSRSAAAVLDVLMDAHARFGFTLLLATRMLTTAARCQRIVTLADGRVADDDLTRDDDAQTRGRIDRIG